MIPKSIIKTKHFFGIAGIFITTVGIIYGYFTNGDILAYITAMIGVLFNGVSYSISLAESKEAERQKKELKQRLKDMDRRIIEAKNAPAIFG